MVLDPVIRVVTSSDDCIRVQIFQGKAKMSQFNFSKLAGNLNKAPKGLNTGLALLAVAGAGAYGVSQSMYTGKERASFSTILQKYFYFSTL